MVGVATDVILFQLGKMGYVNRPFVVTFIRVKQESIQQTRGITFQVSSYCIFNI